MKIAVYIVTHKRFDSSLCDEFVPIAVGEKLINDSSCTYIKDNSGDNISKKNPNFCELTAQYWIYKNCIDVSVKGLCHYRRFFTNAFLSVNNKFFVKTKNIEKILFNDNFDAIVSKLEYSYRGVKEAYLDCGFVKDLDITRTVISELYPDYITTYDKVLSDCCGHIANMIIAKAEIFDAYSTWLFNILFEVEKRIDLTNYTKEEARVFGYISERLLNVWIIKNNISVKPMRIINVEENHSANYYLIEILKRLRIYQISKKIIFKLRG